MPWKETCAMDQRVEFVSAYLRALAPMSALCAAYGISRRTGYKWIDRYRQEGWQGLAERSRAPHEHGRRMAPELAEAIIALRRDRPYWGPRKLRAVLQRQAPELTWPAASTIGDLLRRHGLVVPRRRRPVAPAGPAPAPFAAIEQPNDLWCIDFKGWFRTRDGTRCDPLTVTDAYSRYLLVCTIVPVAHEPVEGEVKVLMSLDHVAQKATKGPGLDGLQLLLHIVDVRRELDLAAVVEMEMVGGVNAPQIEVILHTLA